MPNKQVRGTCAAEGVDRTRCNEKAGKGEQWCSWHREQREVLYKNYKACKAAVERFSEEKVEKRVREVKKLPLGRVQRLHDILKTKRRFLKGCIDAQECFYERFFGEDLDFGTPDNVWHLTTRLDELETVITAVEERYRELILLSEDALWLFEDIKPSGVPSQFLEACCEHPEITLEEARLPAPKDKGKQRLEFDPVGEASRRKRFGLVIGIWNYIARLCTPPESQFFQERLNVIYALIARCICFDATLFVAAWKYHTVEEFLQDLELEVPVLERLMSILSQHDVHRVRAAIDDVLCPSDVEGEKYTFLGVTLHHKLSPASFPFHAWGHWAAFFPSRCLCATKKGFPKAHDISISSRYMQLYGLQIRCLSQYDAAIRESVQILDLCGIHLAYLDPGGLRHSVEKSTGTDGRMYWVETRGAIVIRGAIPLKEPIIDHFVAECTRHPDLMIRIRRGLNGQAVNFPEDIWSRQSRQARTFTELDKAAWTKESASHGGLSDCQDFFTNGMPLKDCLEFAVFDGSDCDFDRALSKLADICLKIHGLKDMDGLKRHFLSVYVEEGELEQDAKGELLSFTCSREDTWLMRMHLLNAQHPNKDHAGFAGRFI
ncbi:hypothetical protein VNI00_000311 [Paramarasmius palmivorus]|uniref:Uncharacterized protein n=1 Tax=Paramarasmius palmivorus TaxID=297713 RepID=A0AAW0EEG9_9AGAR